MVLLQYAGLLNRIVEWKTKVYTVFSRNTQLLQRLEDLVAQIENLKAKC